MCRLLLFVLAMTASISAAAPPDLHSPAIVKQLATALTEQGLEAIAAQDPEDPNRFIAALFVRDAQLLVVSARHPSADALSARLARKEYRDIYLDLSSSQSANSWFLQDMQADGLCSKRGQTADLLYEGTAATIAGARAAHSVTTELPAAARFIFRTGAIDLARRVRADLLVANGVPDLLDRFLTEEERRSLAS
jgi:hypothetical protein